MFYTTRKRGARGFTLVEMLITIAIIGILASVVLGSMAGARERARDAQRISDIAQLQLVLEQYFNACRQYPAPDGGTLDINADNGCTGSIDFGTFLPSIPKDPKGLDYGYGTNGTDTDYRLGVTLETNDAVLLRNAPEETYGPGCDIDDLEYCVRP